MTELIARRASIGSSESIAHLYHIDIAMFDTDQTSGEGKFLVSFKRSGKEDKIVQARQLGS